MTARLLHVGIVVEDLDRAVAKYRGLLGFEELGPAQDMPQFNLRVVRLRGDGIDLELAQPLQEQSRQTVRKGVHHLAFSTPDIGRDTAQLHGGTVAEGKAFLPPDENEGGLCIELIQQ